MEEDPAKVKEQQERHYFYLSELQSMASDLPL